MAVLLLVAMCLRLHRLGDGLWFDEIQTLVDYVRLPLAQIITTFDSQNQHLLYSVAARLAIVGLGESSFALRLPAALFGVASLWAAYQFAREVTGARQALLVMALLTVSYHHLWFSQDARGYTGLLLWALLGTTAFLRLLRDPDAGLAWIALYGVSMGLAAYTHITAAFTSLAHIFVLLTLGLKSRSDPGRPWLQPLLGVAASALIGLALYAPVLPQFIATLLAPSPHAADTDWQSPVWFLTETMQGLSRGLPGGWLSMTVGAIVAAAGLWSFWRQQPALVVLMVLPGLLTGAAMIALGHNLWPRFFFFSAGFAVVIAVRGVFTVAQGVLPRHGGAIATTLLVLLASGSASTVPRAWGPKQDYQGAAAYVAGHRAPGEAAATVDLTIFPYQRYIPCPCTPLNGPRDLADLEATHPRVWVLYTFPVRLAATQPELWQHLQADYDTAAIFPGTVGGGAIVVMVSRASSHPPRGRP